MVLSWSQVLLVAGVFLSAVWVLIALAFSMVFSFIYLVDKEIRDEFRKHIVRCVVEDRCPVADSWIHVAVERMMRSFITRGSLMRGVSVVWVGIFFQALLFPLSKAEIVIRKIV